MRRLASIPKNSLFLMISGLLILPVLLGACLPPILEPPPTASEQAAPTPIPPTATQTATPTLTPTPTQTALPSLTPTATSTLTPSPSPTPVSHVLVGAGDIAICGHQGDEQTALLLDEIDGTIFTTGDNVYNSGTPEQFQECFDPSWGRHKDRIRPSAGNHDYGTPGAAGYFDYFGGLPASRIRVTTATTWVNGISWF
jgi:hypothetical protein